MPIPINRDLNLIRRSILMLPPISYDNLNHNRLPFPSHRINKFPPSPALSRRTCQHFPLLPSMIGWKPWLVRKAQATSDIG